MRILTDEEYDALRNQIAKLEQDNQALERAVQEEREACAKLVADADIVDYYDYDDEDLRDDAETTLILAARAIRARKP